ATGVTTTIRNFIKLAAEEIGIEITFKGEGRQEKGYITSVDESIFNIKVGKEYLQQIHVRIKLANAVVAVDPQYFRPTEVDLLIGDATKARTRLNWEPSYDLNGLIEDMMQSDIKLMHKDAWLKSGGYKTLNYFE
ncbi:MAG: GDP-mannose 4,6-dehydratase, partial [Bacteroidales bacterium]|nr:GDP-mannose 4,6-dehydratase [Bacteroidales bacterium]